MTAPRSFPHLCACGHAARAHGPTYENLSDWGCWYCPCITYCSVTSFSPTKADVDVRQ